MGQNSQASPTGGKKEGRGATHHGPRPTGSGEEELDLDARGRPRRGQRAVNEHGVRSNDSRQRRHPPLLDRKKSIGSVGLGGWVDEASSRHGGAEDSGERHDGEGSVWELGGVRIQAREVFGSCFLLDRSRGSGVAVMAPTRAMARSFEMTKRLRGTMRTGAGTLGPGIHGGGVPRAAVLFGSCERERCERRE